MAAATAADQRRVALAASAVSLVVLVLLLRSLVAPVHLLLGNVLSVASALGLTTWVFQDLLDRPGIAFYVPFARPTPPTARRATRGPHALTM
ncbi:MMPL family transporter [Quadrisphaera sp. DSM 44207]|uniref:MMPL family transporter n=1 Tax=Quadrisphaera sp. DSM 44207 TaxID=1881057 RepID=UPI000B8894BB|nr:MMPL family transporter [Quadrisphaera sp. DSM 44207]